MSRSAPKDKNSKKSLGEFSTTVKEAITLPLVVRLIRNLFAVSIWGALFIHAFIFELTGPAIAVIPQIEPLIQFRFLVFLGIATLVVLSLWNRYLFLFVDYITFFPLVVLFWVLPRTVFRNWLIVLAFWPAIHSFFSTLKVSFLLLVAAVVSCFGVALFTDVAIITICLGMLVVYLVRHYVRRVHTAFSSKTSFAALTPMFQNVWEGIADQEQTPIEEEPGSDGYKRKFGQRLLNLYFFTTCLYIVGKKLRTVIRTKVLDLYLVCSFVYTFLLTVVVFTFVFLGINRLEPSHFSSASEAGVFEFLGYSLSTAMNAGISPIAAKTLLAQMFSYAEMFFILLLPVLLVFVLFTSARERYRQDLDEIVGEISGVSDRLGQFLLQNHDLTLAAADQYLLQMNPLLARWALKVLYGEERAKAIPGFIDDETDEVVGSNETPSIEKPSPS